VYWLLSATVRGAFGGRVEAFGAPFDEPVACGSPEASDQIAAVLLTGGFFRRWPGSTKGSKTG